MSSIMHSLIFHNIPHARLKHSEWADLNGEKTLLGPAGELSPNGSVYPAVVSAGTDNRAFPQAVDKGSSMTWPLMGILMQMSSHPASFGARLKPQWRPREENVEADDQLSL